MSSHTQQHHSAAPHGGNQHMNVPPDYLQGPKPDPWGMRKFAITLLAAACVAIGTSYWNTQVSQSTLLYRLDKLEQQVERMAKTQENVGETATQNAIRMALFEQTQKQIHADLEQLKFNRPR